MDEIKVGSKVIVKVGRNEIQAVVLKAWAGHWYVKSEATGRAFFTHRLVCVAEDSARASVNPNVQLVGACEIDHVFNDVIREQERNQATTQENTMPENEIEQNVNEIEVAEPESTLPDAALEPETEQDTAPEVPRAKKKMSLMDAAIEILKQANEPMNTKEIVKAAINKGLWIPTECKTPEQTLYGTIFREITTKENPRIVKAEERGKFKLG